MEKVMNRYDYKDWDSVLASIGHGGLKEGQVINKMLEEREKKLKREITDADVLSGIADTAGRSGEASVRKSKSGIMVKGDLDLFSDSVYCFTPSGDVKTLPSGSTPIDFAYCIHSAVGNKMVGARVNGKLVPIEYVIQNGDQLEIITSQNSKGPSRDWLGIVKSTQAKNKINQWFKSQMKEDNLVRGRDQIERYCKAKGINWSEIG